MTIPEMINRIIISRMKFIGDVVLTTPLIRRVRRHFPGAVIAYLGEAAAVELLRGNPHLDEILPYDFARPDVLEQPRMMLALRRRKPDVFIDLYSNPRSAMLAYASGASVRVGKDVSGRGSLYTHRIADDGRPKTAIDFHFQYLAPLGIPAGPLGPGEYRTEIVLSDHERQRARDLLAGLDIDPSRPVVGLHAGATWPAKMWPKEYFAALADLIAGRLNAQVVLTQGPKDADLVAAIRGEIYAPAAIMPSLSLRELAAVIAQMRVYVANDSGPMHIAAAVGTRTLGIFGPGEEDVWFPYVPPYREPEAGHAVLRHDVPCHPCHLDFCNRTGEGYMECMRKLTAAEVFAVVETMMDDGK